MAAVASSATAIDMSMMKAPSAGGHMQNSERSA
jgi:hypothetical protein